MALDFPNTPTLNQVFTASNGAMWLWDGVKWTAIASTSAYAGNTNVGRNLLHNPLFNVAQRGIGGFSINGTYSADRWILGNDTDAQNVVIYAMVDGDRTSIGDEAATSALGNTFTGSATASAFNAVHQRMEGTRRFAGKNVIVSFYAKLNAGPATKLGVNIDQVFGTGGSPSPYVPVNGQAVTLTGVWQRFSLQFAVPSASGKTFGTTAGSDWTQVGFWFSSGATNNIRTGNIGVQSGNIALWGVQLEVGSVATPLEKPDPRYDLANCQRFYQTGSVGVSLPIQTLVNGWGGQHYYLFPVPMHHAPTMTTTPTTQLACTGTAVSAGSNNVFQHNYTVSQTGGGVASTANWTASADL